MNAVGVCGDPADISPLTHMSADGDGADGPVLLPFGLKHKWKYNSSTKFSKPTSFYVLKSLKYITKHIVCICKSVCGGETSVLDKNMEHTSGWWDYWAQKWALLVY